MTVEVGDERAIRFLEGRGGPRVYATPCMVADMERNCGDLLRTHLDENEDSLGTYVCIRHLAATPMGMKVVHRARLRQIDGRRCIFEVEVHDDKEQVGAGEHHRMIVNLKKFADRVAAKHS